MGDNYSEQVLGGPRRCEEQTCVLGDMKTTLGVWKGVTARHERQLEMGKL